MKESPVYFALIIPIIFIGVAGLILTAVLNEIIHPDSLDLSYKIALGVRSLFGISAAICILLFALMVCFDIFGKERCRNDMYFLLTSSILCTAFAGMVLTQVLTEIIHPDSNDLSYKISLGVRSFIFIGIATGLLFIAVTACSMAFGKDSCCSKVRTAPATNTVGQSTAPKPNNNKIVPTSLLPPDQQRSPNIV